MGVLQPTWTVRRHRVGSKIVVDNDGAVVRLKALETCQYLACNRQVLYNMNLIYFLIIYIYYILYNVYYIV